MDDEINAVLVNPLLPGVRLHAVIDACHSGSAMDLEYRCKVKQVGLNWKQEYARRTRVYKVTASLTFAPPDACLEGSSQKAAAPSSRRFEQKLGKIILWQYHLLHRLKKAACLPVD